MYYNDINNLNMFSTLLYFKTTQLRCLYVKHIVKIYYTKLVFQSILEKTSYISIVSVVTLKINFGIKRCFLKIIPLKITVNIYYFSSKKKKSCDIIDRKY